MRFIKKLFSIADIIIHAILALSLGIVYVLFWLFSLLICLPLLCVLFVPLIIFIPLAGFITVSNRLTEIDENT